MLTSKDLRRMGLFHVGDFPDAEAEQLVKEYKGCIAVKGYPANGDSSYRGVYITTWE